MRRICDRLEAPQFSVIRSNVVLQDPEVSTLHSLRQIRFIMAIDQLPIETQRNLWSITAAVSKSHRYLLDLKLEIISGDCKRIAGSYASVSVGTINNAARQNDFVSCCSTVNSHSSVRISTTTDVVIANIRLIGTTTSWKHESIVLRSNVCFALVFILCIRWFYDRFIAGQFGCLNMFITGFDIDSVWYCIGDRWLIFIRSAVVL